MPKYPPIGLDDRLRFGKHGPKDGRPGRELWEVMETDLDYVTWLIEEGIATLDNEAFEEYRRRIGKR